ncbi:MAG: hypothetical protein ACLQBD_06220 [Syntrophobacteraceae bacterium]
MALESEDVQPMQPNEILHARQILAALSWKQDNGCDKSSLWVTLRDFTGAQPGVLALGSATPRAEPIPIVLQPRGKKGVGISALIIGNEILSASVS